MEVELKIRKYLEVNGISQAYVSRNAGIAPAKLSMSMAGKRQLTLAEYAAICWALGVNTDFFLKPKPPDTK